MLYIRLKSTICLEGLRLGGLILLIFSYTVLNAQSGQAILRQLPSQHIPSVPHFSPPNEIGQMQASKGLLLGLEGASLYGPGLLSTIGFGISAKIGGVTLNARHTQLILQKNYGVSSSGLTLSHRLFQQASISGGFVLLMADSNRAQVNSGVSLSLSQKNYHFRFSVLRPELLLSSDLSGQAGASINLESAFQLDKYVSALGMASLEMGAPSSFLLGLRYCNIWLIEAGLGFEATDKESQAIQRWIWTIGKYDGGSSYGVLGRLSFHPALGWSSSLLWTKALWAKNSIPK